MQSTVGNLPEFFVVIFALEAGQRIVAETAILGSILVNALLVLGLVIVAGAAASARRDHAFQSPAAERHGHAAADRLVHHRARRAGRTPPTTPPATTSRRSRSSARARSWSCTRRGCQYLRSPAGARRRPRAAPGAAADGDRAARRRRRGSAFVSDWFIHALQPTIHQLHISKAFAGLVIVAIAGNAVENVAGIALAYKGKGRAGDLGRQELGRQIAAFLYPLLVLVSLLTSTTLTFALAPCTPGLCSERR